MRKTAMMHLIDKINRMPETNIKNFIKLLGDEYIIQEKEQIKDAWTDGCIGELYELNAYFSSEKYYNKTYGNQ
jgi:hypothetical protein